MTEFLGTGRGQIACEVTGLTAGAGEVVAAPPELVWDLVADVTRVGQWSPECAGAAWLEEPVRPAPGARFTGHNRFPDGFEYEVTCTSKAMTISEIPRNKANSPTRTSSSAPRTGRYGPEAQRSFRAHPLIAPAT
jgi:Polyketide cyclase / dehydrase and lipid transport